MTQQLVVPAWGERTFELTERAAEEIHHSGLATVALSGTSGRYRVCAGASVGVAAGSDWDLRVDSHLDVRQLMFLLCFARDPRGWRDAIAPFQTELGLQASIAHAYATLVERAFARGVLRGYRALEEQSSVLRGRLLVGRQLARGGLPMPVDLERDDYEVDTDENRVLLAALWRLERLHGVQPEARARIRRLRFGLDGVTLVRDPRRLTWPRGTRLNAHYRPALAIARVILDRSSIRLGRGSVDATTFAFELHRVFEQFLEVAFGAAVSRLGGELRAQETGRHLDAGVALPLKPDLVVRSGGRCVAVLDAKFKHLERGLAGDAYQALAYALEFDVPRSYLIAAQGCDADYAIPSADRRIALRVVDVSKTPEEILQAVDVLAREVMSVQRARSWCKL